MASSSRRLQLEVLLAAIDKATKPLKGIQGASGKTAEALRNSRRALEHLQRAQADVSSFAALKRRSLGTAQALEQQQAKVRELSRAMNAADQPTKQLVRQHRNAINTARQLTQKLQGEQQQLHQLRNTMVRVEGVHGTMAQQQRELASRINATNRSISTQQQRLGRLAAQQRASAAASERLQQAQDRNSRLAGTGARAMGAGGVGLYATSRLLSPGISFGETSSELQAVTRLQRESEEFQALDRQAKELGISTFFSATEANAGQIFLARAGFTPKAILTSMQDVLDLALVGKLDLGRAADISSNIAGVFKLSPEIAGNMQRVADVLTATSTRANVDIEMLGQTMKYLGSASGLNLQIEEAAAMAGILGNIGIQGQMAGTSVRAMMNRLTALTPRAQKHIQKLGIELTDAQGNMRSFPVILGDFAKATENMGNAERQAIFSQIFDAEAAGAMAELIGQQGAGAITKFVEELKRASGENARTSKIMADNLGGDLKGLRSAWEGFGIGLTNVNNGPLRRIVQSFTRITRGIAGWVERNPRLSSTLFLAATGVMALVTAGGALTLMLASLLGPFALVRYGTTMLGIGSWRALPGLKALGGVVAFLGRVALPMLLQALRTVALASVANPIGIAVLAIATAALLLVRYWQPIKAFFSGIFSGIREGLAPLGDQFRALYDNLAPVRAVVDLVRRGFGLFAGVLRDLLSPIEYSDQALRGATEAGQGFGYFIGRAVYYALTPLRGLLMLINVITRLPFGEWASAAAARLREAFAGGVAGVVRLLLSFNPGALLWRGIVAGLEMLGAQIPTKFRTLGSAIVDGLLGGIKDKWDALSGGVSELGSKIGGAFREKLGINSPSRVFAQYGRDTVAGYQQGLNSEQAGVIRQLQGWTQQLRHAGAGLALGMGATTMAAAAPAPADLRLGMPALPTLQAHVPALQAPALPPLDARLGMPALPRLQADLPALPPLRVQLPDLPPLTFEPLPEIRIDRRPPLPAGGGSASGGDLNVGGITITIHAAPGMDERDIGDIVERRVQAALDRAMQKMQQRRRSAFYDTE